MIFRGKQRENNFDSLKSCGFVRCYPTSRVALEVFVDVSLFSLVVRLGKTLDTCTMTEVTSWIGSNVWVISATIWCF